MTYFRELPDLEYQSFLSDRQRSNDYLRVKNLFRRGKLRDDISNVLTVFDKYEIPDGYRPDNVAEELYRNSGYDWVVLISAGIINVRNEWPISDGDLYTYVIQKYGDELYGTHHYITAEIKDSNDRLILSEGKLVNSTLQIPFPSYASEISFSDLNVQINYFVQSIQVTNGGSGYTSPPSVDISDPEGPNGISAEASANIDENGRVSSIDVISSGTQYKLNPTLTFSGGGGVGAAATTTLYPSYYAIESATLPVSGISTITLVSNLNNNVSAGTTVHFARISLQIATSISLEWVGAGTNINTAKPALGGVTIQENEVVRFNGGQVVYTSTNQAGNFKIGDDVTINQVTGTITGRAFSQSLLNTVTPLIIALGK